MTNSEAGAATIQERYWRRMVQARADVFFTSRYALFAETLDNLLSIIAALVTSGSIAAWAYWKTHTEIWGVLVAIAQVIAVTKQFLPFKKRIGPMKSLSARFEEIAIRAEAKWHQVAEGDITASAINDLMTSFKQERHEASKRCLGETIIPFNALVRWRADCLTTEYFQQEFGTTTRNKP